MDVSFATGAFTAIMGPSGSGKSTLMHCLAGLDTVTAGTVHIGDVELTGLGDKQLTLLRRERIGFIFQAFNLLPTLTAEQNIRLPLEIAGRQADQRAVRPGHRHRRACATGSATSRPSCPAASSSAWRWPGR